MNVLVDTGSTAENLVYRLPKKGNINMDKHSTCRITFGLKAEKEFPFAIVVMGAGSSNCG